MLDKALKECNEKLMAVEEAKDMIQLKIRKERKTKFVQYFADMQKECERARFDVDQVREDVIEMKVPKFDYVIVERGVDQAVQCNKDGSDTLAVKTIESR